MTGTRRVSWDLLRCAFLLMVVLYHSTFIAPLVYHQFAARSFVFAHQIGASLLLSLSAYFVASTLADPARATARWWWSRVARLLPAFVVATLLAFAALRWLAPAGMFHPSLYNLATSLLMLWNWNGVRHWYYVDPSYWTLPLQLMAFSLAPLVRRSRLATDVGCGCCSGRRSSSHWRSGRSSRPPGRSTTRSPTASGSTAGTCSSPW